MLKSVITKEFVPTVTKKMAMLVIITGIGMSQMVSVALGAETTSGSTDTYLVNPGDILMVSIWREPDLSSEVLVRPDGRFSFPLVGEVVAANKSIAQLVNELTQNLQSFIPDAEVMVTVMQTSGNTAYVVGQVTRPGEFVISHQLDVMQALSKAGGVNAFADKGDIKILRRVEGRQQALRFNYNEVSKGKKLEQNILLKSGDVIVVP